MESGEWRGKSDNDPLSTTHYPLFSVRTPTALVTDLGTEFGVEIDGSGVSRAYVFQGKVELRPAEGNNVVLLARASRLASNGAQVKLSP